MIYLDHGATSFPKPRQVTAAMVRAMERCGNPGRGGHKPAMEAARTVFACREQAAKLFDCREEQMVFTSSCTHGLNMAIRTLVQPGDPVVISGFEHNAVTRQLYALGAKVTVAGRRLFSPEDTLWCFEQALKKGQKAAVVTHVSNAFGYILPIEEISVLCKRYRTPLVVDAAQSAGILPVSLKKLEADFIAMPGHKGLLGPQGTGILLCQSQPQPLLYGGTGTMSRQQEMPAELPEGAEAGTLNVPGIAGLAAGIGTVRRLGFENILAREQREAQRCARRLEQRGYRVFCGASQSGTVSFLPPEDCEVFAEELGRRGVAVRAGLHCAPLAHESAGTLETGTVRISFGHNASPEQTEALCRAIGI